MACTSCATNDTTGTPKGCQNQGSCATGNCNKLTVFDWLENISLPAGQKPFDVVEVRFKNSRKEFYRNHDNMPLTPGQVIAVEASGGHDIGIVSLTGELVRVQMKKKNEKTPINELLKIYRIANQKDIAVWQSCREKEETIKVKARQLAIRLGLQMKISDIEYQGDGSKITFYYTSETRIDFRQLIKDFARDFQSRIEMKQIGFRQEASRLGGIGSCGRELCCSTWLTDFRTVNTNAARYQQLSLNPLKLAGQCGKLKCCLNYELDAYMDALKDFPPFDTVLKTVKGKAICQKQDIFKSTMWFSVEGQMEWVPLHINDVKVVLNMNKNNEVVEQLEDYAVEIPKVEKVIELSAINQDSLTRFDRPKRQQSNNKNKNFKKPFQNKEKQAVGSVETRTFKPKPSQSQKESQSQNQPNKQSQPQKQTSNQPSNNQKKKFKPFNKNNQKPKNNSNENKN
jgi:cell fate regulator YaaT (PSP1 superfamily)